MPPTLTCPDCGGEMASHDLEPGTTIDTCKRCYGYWFDPGEIEAYVARHGRATERSGSAAGLRLGEPATRVCPRCTTASLHWTTFRGIPALGCRSCHGIFLAARALDRIPTGPSSADSVRPLVAGMAEYTAIDAVGRLLGSVWDFWRRH